MHEVALMQGVIASITTTAKQANATKIAQVALVLGASGHLTEAGVRQHFAVLATGTAAEGADLSIEWLPATFRCFTCLHAFTSLAEEEFITCPECGGQALEIAHQDVCYAREITVADPPTQEP